MTPIVNSAKYWDDVQLEYICCYWATVLPPEIIGPLAEGLRINVYVTGGEVSGPKMRAGSVLLAATGSPYVQTASAYWTFAPHLNWKMGR